VGRPLVGREGLAALLRRRPVTGALALVAGAALLATGSLRLSSLLAPRSSAAFLLGAYVIAWTQLVLVLWALSLFGWVTLTSMGGYPNCLVLPRLPTLKDIDGPNGTLSQPDVVKVKDGLSTGVESSQPIACPVDRFAPQDVGLRTYLLVEPLRMNDRP